MTFPFPIHVPVPPLQLVNQATGTNSATSFSVDPSSLGAAVNDLMVVCSMWEDNSAVTHPSGWTTIVEQEAPCNSVARFVADYQIFSSVPSTQTWSYSGASGIAFAWQIYRYVSGVGTHTFTQDENASVGLVDTSVTLGSSDKAVAFFSFGDGSTETGETASLSGAIANPIEEGSGHTTGFYAMCGHVLADGTVSFTTTTFTRRSMQQIQIPIT